MTGYGRAEITLEGVKIVIEIRSVNGKSADVGIKSSLIPRSKEPEIRRLLASKLQRGTIDLFLYSEGIGVGDRPINRALFDLYYREIQSIIDEYPELGDQSQIVGTILRIPEVLDRKNEEPNETLWEVLLQGIELACKEVNIFRENEGQQLYKDMIQRVELIESLLAEAEVYEGSRLEKVKERLRNKLREVGENVQPDPNRFEQELIYYLEKLDITEEKVRLRQHCTFFKQTLMSEDFPGRKLGFISQEIGREINTLGSKANQADIQRRVVAMKDELEKIKEQVMNIL
jgi:uncharacterized protein (TIGR00255 family)